MELKMREGKEKKVNLEERKKIVEVLKEAGINPETVIVRKGDKIIPETEKVGNEDFIKLIPVVSGG